MPSPLRLAAINDEPASADGRRRRSQDSRARIVEAMLELIHAGEVSPSAEQVAARAGVGLRTVFRHFKEMDSLYREMSMVIEAEVLKIVDQPFTSAPGVDRLLELVGRRAQAYEKLSPFKRAADLRRHESTFLAAGHVRLALIAREILKREAPAAVVKDKLTFEALDLLLSWESWSRLRRDQALTPKRAREVLEASLRKMLS